MEPPESNWPLARLSITGAESTTPPGADGLAPERARGPAAALSIYLSLSFSFCPCPATGYTWSLTYDSGL
jgi:hypothetical protein